MFRCDPAVPFDLQTAQGLAFKAGTMRPFSSTKSTTSPALGTIRTSVNGVMPQITHEAMALKESRNRSK